VLTQERNSSDKIYSIHQPHVKCIAKGKEAKKYEFGNKSSIVKTRKSGIIVGAMAFTDNIYDGDTLLPQLEQTQRLTGRKPKVEIADRGYKGRKNVNGVQIIIPTKLPALANNYQKQKMRKRFRARAGIEPIIGHLKQDHRMSRNYLLDEQGDPAGRIRVQPKKNAPADKSWSTGNFCPVGLGCLWFGLEPKICILKNQGFFTFDYL